MTESTNTPQLETTAPSVGGMQFHAAPVSGHAPHDHTPHDMLPAQPTAGHDDSNAGTPSPHTS